MKAHNNEKGLTLVELLITISVLAIVAAIALPVINNVVAASNNNAYYQTIKDADAFINKYSKSGVVSYDGFGTLRGYVDTNGDNNIQDPTELIDTLALDSKYTVTITGGTNPNNGDAYTNGGITGVTIADPNGASVPTGNAAIAITAQYNNVLVTDSNGATQSPTWSLSTPVYADVSGSLSAPAGTYYAFTTVAGAEYMMMMNGLVDDTDSVYTHTRPYPSRVTIFTHYLSNPTIAGWTKGTLSYPL